MPVRARFREIISLFDLPDLQGPANMSGVVLEGVNRDSKSVSRPIGWRFHIALNPRLVDVQPNPLYSKKRRFTECYFTTHACGWASIGVGAAVVVGVAVPVLADLSEIVERSVVSASWK